MPLTFYRKIRAGIIRVNCKSPAELRFWKSVDKEGPLHPVLGTRCLVWTGSKVKNGYGSIQVLGRHVGTHRFSWERYNGPIPDTLHVLHLCDNPACVNPAHLFLDTNSDNAADRMNKGRNADAKGERNNNAKLTVEQVREIRRRYCRTSQNTSNALRLAAEFGVSTGSINAIISRRYWKYV
jgi:hypothetical protein